MGYVDEMIPNLSVDVIIVSEGGDTFQNNVNPC